MGPLDDHEVAAVSHDAKLRSKTTRVLDAVVDRQLRVARAPENDCRTGDRAQVAARIVGDHRTGPALRVRVLTLRVEQAERRPRCQRDGVRHEPGPEDGSAVPGALGVAMAERRDHAAGPDRRRGECDRPCNSRRGRDPRRGHEQERAHELGPALRKPDRDEPSERVTRDEDRA